jgi:predicted dehydrogenase
MLRWGILGAGSVARRRVLPAMAALEDCSITSLMVRDLSAAQQLAAEHGATRGVDRVDQLVSDAEVDAVYVSTPVYLHADHVAAAAEAGKHVLCEKPMGRDAGECERIIRACQRAGVHLEVCFVLRGWPIYQQIRRILSSGELGRIVEIRAHLAKWMPREPGEWRLDPELGGGGAFMDVGSHYLDLFRFLLGEPVRLAYMDSSKVFGWGVEESGFALIEFDNGAHGTLSVSCTVPHPDHVLEVYGTEGSLFLGKELRVVRGSNEEILPAVFPDYYSGLLTHFCQAAAHGLAPLASGHDGLQNIRIIQAAYASARSGTMMSVPMDKAATTPPAHAGPPGRSDR